MSQILDDLFFIVIGMSRQHMKKTDNEVITDLTSSNFPAWVMKIEISANLLAILLTRGRHCSTVGLYIPKGIPR